MGSEAGSADAGGPRRSFLAPNYNREVDRSPDNAAILKDADLVMSAALTSFDLSSPEWQAIVQRLYPYARRVLLAWLRDGAIFQKLIRIRVAARIQGEPVDLTADQRHELVADVVTDALAKFRKNVLLKRVWDPGRGTQLTTFFVRYCLLQFPDHYNRLRDRVLNERSTHDRLPQQTDHRQRTAEQALARVELTAVAEKCVNGHQDDVVQLRAWLEDRPLQEVADELAVTYKAAEYRRAKLRTRLEASGRSA